MAPAQAFKYLPSILVNRDQSRAPDTVLALEDTNQPLGASWLHRTFSTWKWAAIYLEIDTCNRAFSVNRASPNSII